MTQRFLEIPYKQLSPEALRGVIEEFVTREGSDYGEETYSLEQKSHQISEQLRLGRAVITYDQETQSCNILLKNGK